jgi:hypothetical protein
VGSPDQYEDLRRGVREVCADFSDGYWRELDARREYPEAFIGDMHPKLEELPLCTSVPC